MLNLWKENKKGYPDITKDKKPNQSLGLVHLAHVLAKFDLQKLSKHKVSNSSYNTLLYGKDAIKNHIKNCLECLTQLATFNILTDM